MQFAATGNDVFVGNYEACAMVQVRLWVHVWHPSQPGHCAACAPLQATTDDCRISKAGLFLRYREHDPLPAETLEALANYARQKGKLLIHCAAGIGRSPTLAVACHAARGQSVFQALGDIAYALWHHYALPVAPDYDRALLEQIFRYFKE